MQGVLHGRHHRVIGVRRAVAEVHAHTELVVLNKRAWDLLHPTECKNMDVLGSHICVSVSHCRLAAVKRLHKHSLQRLFGIQEHCFLQKLHMDSVHQLDAWGQLKCVTTLGNYLINHIKRHRPRQEEQLCRHSAQGTICEYIKGTTMGMCDAVVKPCYVIIPDCP